MATVLPRSFVSRRLHSLLGVIPIGAFLIEHLIANYSAVGGPEKFEATVRWINSLPFVLLMEIFFIYLPILFHAVLGVVIAFQPKNTLPNYGYFRNWMFYLQRLTGLITLIYIAWHVWETRVQAALGQPVNFEMMKNILDNPVSIAFYIIGILSTVFHFSNGLWSFAVSWGLAVGPRAQRQMTYVSAIVFVFLSYVGLMALFAFIA
ncbi:succinate dehydrogenase cytochrome b558 subunit [Hydrogenibacillus sp. N12]|uniref:succinate dehydrogenase cytochrome b558 subunit n=1 Tax=Hydrogenibacillus sp. N12 TaxID=2866627 RepID=UPI001C7D3A16|nr:succinate dehydrogenase cytochrome b558 subunit [Hydrogenibacillus sp. N12]QZA32389.1 succinate dehydrogenase cytochrome b558 subunit [Hydrogenibacillus sp. N12]